MKIVTVAEGEINELHVGLKGTMNALFLSDLRQKVRRGLEGRVRQGRSGGGLCGTCRSCALSMLGSGIGFKRGWRVFVTAPACGKRATANSGSIGDPNTY